MPVIATTGRVAAAIETEQGRNPDIVRAGSAVTVNHSIDGAG